MRAHRLARHQEAAGDVAALALELTADQLAEHLAEALPPAALKRLGEVLVDERPVKAQLREMLATEGHRGHDLRGANNRRRAAALRELHELRRQLGDVDPIAKLKMLSQIEELEARIRDLER